MSNLIIYEMCDLRDLIEEVTGGVENLNSFEFKSPKDKRKVEQMAASVLSGAKVSVSKRISFVGYFLSQCRFIPTFKLEAPMACNATTRGLTTKMNIFYNPFWMAYKMGIQKKENIFLDTFANVGHVLLHEAFHLLYNHLDTYDYFLNKGYSRMVNVATDCQINQEDNIARDEVLTEYGITLDSVKKLTGDSHLRPKESSKYYMEALMEKAKSFKDKPSQSGGGQGQGQSGIDQKEQIADNSHKVWKQTPEDVDGEKYGEVASPQSTQEAVKEAVETSIKQGDFDPSDLKSRGLVAGEIIDSIIEGKSRSTKLPIKHFIQKGIGRIKMGRKKTYSKMHRHQASYFRIMRGRKDITAKNIYLFYDTSGSISQREIEWTFQEIAGLAYKAKVDLWAIPFDAQVYPQHLSKIGKDGSYNNEIVGRGGTSFQPIFDYMKEKQRDAIANDDLVIIFTDGGGESRVETRGCKNIIWVLIGQDKDCLSVQDPIGMLAYLEDDEKYQIHKMSEIR